MTGAAVHVGLEGDGAALAALGRAASAIGDPTPMFQDIGSMLVASTQQRFEDEAAPDGSPWPMSIRAMTQGGKTLTDTALLKNSISFAASEDGVEVGTNVPYAGPHQSGAVIKARTPRGLRFQIAGQWVNKAQVTIPARPFLGLDADDDAAIVRIAGTFLQAAVEGGSNAG